MFHNESDVFPVLGLSGPQGDPGLLGFTGSPGQKGCKGDLGHQGLLGEPGTTQKLETFLTKYF